MRLPNAERAALDIRKLREYTLNPVHLAGANKAWVFASCLGIGQQDAEVLREVCLRAILSSEAIEKVTDSRGKRYQVDFVMQTGESLRSFARVGSSGLQKMFPG
jgi:hypothetical protein